MLQGLDKHFDHACKPGSADGVCRVRGGESCAFDGAMIVLQCIADAAHLVHGPIACLGNSWEGRGTVSDRGNLHRRSYTTDLNELDIIYGAEERLRLAIHRTARDARPAAIFVYATCVTGLIGEDLGAVCRTASSELGLPVIPVDAPGFVGPKNLGNRIAGDVLVQHVIGRNEPPVRTATDINLIGEYNIQGDLANVEPLFARAGIRVLSHITGNASFEEITWAHRARASAVVCSRALINVARELEAGYGIPFREISFYGKTEMSRALRVIAAMLEPHDSGIGNRVERVILLEEARLEERLMRYSHLRGKKAVLYTGGVKSWSVVSALMDLGIEVVAVGTKKSTYEDEEKIRGILGPDAPVHENMTPKTILSLVKQHGADMLIAGGRNLYLAIKEGIPFVDVNQERHRAYAGYEGLLHLAEEISHSMLFYERTRPTRSGSRLHFREAPTSIEKVNREVVINPLKHSMSMGAAMAFQGIDRALVVMHGAQGCNFLGKVLLTGHFHEPISLIGSKLFVEDVVMGSDEQLRSTIMEAIQKDNPDVVAVLTTGLSEVRGEDIAPVVRDLPTDATVLFLPTPDYRGGLEEGYNQAVSALADLVRPGPVRGGLVNVLCGSALTPGDIDELRNILEDFGLEAIFLPDLSCMDGSREGFGPLASGGTNIASVHSMGSASHTLVLGGGLIPAAEKIRAQCGVPFTAPGSLSGLENSDRLFDWLGGFSGRSIPERYRRQRKVLVDTMRDGATFYSSRRVAVALESEKALMMSEVIHEMGGRVDLCVVPLDTGDLERIPASRIVVGDFAALEGAGEFDLLISNSHGAEIAREIGTRHLEWGFPALHALGYNASVSIGYRGSLNLICKIGNALNAS